MAIDTEKERFLKQFGQDYGYPNAPKTIDEIRATEFKRLGDTVYLDHAGATLYSESQMEAVFKDLSSTLYGNPHSQSNCSLNTSDTVNEARQQVLQFFNASPGEYRCIFTSGATAALKLVGETFPWNNQSIFAYIVENHNSVLGIREYALNEGAAALAVDVEEITHLDQQWNRKSTMKVIPHDIQRKSETGCRKKDQSSDAYNLFAFPSECNFSGVKFSLDLVNIIKEGSYDIPGTSSPHSGVECMLPLLITPLDTYEIIARPLHDREWLLKSLTGEVLTQKKVLEMSSITTSIDLKSGLFFVESPHCKKKLEIELMPDPSTSGREVMDLYCRRYEVQYYHDEIDSWFGDAISRPRTLVRSFASQNNECLNRNRGIAMCRDVENRLNFVNEAQFLLISEESIADLNSRLRLKLQNGSHEPPIDVAPMRFRPNLVFSGGEPYAENGWRSLKIGDAKFMSLGGCNRCQMINMTSKAGKVQKSNEPLATLASYRRLKGKIYFGVLLRLDDGVERDMWLSVGDKILPRTD